MGFTRASSLENMYHRNRNQKRNVKYYNKKTGQEVIFNENGTIVTDPENIGTFNYAPPADKMGHFLADMVPYYLFGNSKDDSTPIINRIISRPELWSDLLYEKYNVLFPNLHFKYTSNSHCTKAYSININNSQSQILYAYSKKIKSDNVADYNDNPLYYAGNLYLNGTR